MKLQKKERLAWWQRNQMKIACGIHVNYAVMSEISLNKMSFMGKTLNPRSYQICKAVAESPHTGLSKSCNTFSVVLQNTFGIISLKSQMDHSQGCQCNTNGHLSSGVLSKGWWRMAIIWTSTILFLSVFTRRILTYGNNCEKWPSASL